jgi:hypothetical protein
MKLFYKLPLRVKDKGPYTFNELKTIAPPGKYRIIDGSALRNIWFMVREDHTVWWYDAAEASNTWESYKFKRIKS